MPDRCPICGAEAVREEGEAVKRCIGIECSAKALRSIVLCFKRKMGNRMSPVIVIIEQLIDKNLLAKFQIIYEFKIRMI